MRYYVLANRDVKYYKSRLEALEAAVNLSTKKDNYYVAYGVENYDGWQNCIIAVLKCEQEWLDGITGSEV